MMWQNKKLFRKSVNLFVVTIKLHICCSQAHEPSSSTGDSQAFVKYPQTPPNRDYNLFDGFRGLQSLETNEHLQNKTAYWEFYFTNIKKYDYCNTDLLI